jgi:tetratricopeptide (TPR) repeat protein
MFWVLWGVVLLNTFSDENFDMEIDENGKVQRLRYKGKDILPSVDKSLRSAYRSIGCPPEPTVWRTAEVPDETKQLLNDFFDDLSGLSGMDETECVKASAASAFFNGMGALLRAVVMNRQSPIGRDFWNALLRDAMDWESKHAGIRIHKSAIYYSLGLLYLNMGDVDSAFASFYAALEEYKELEKRCPKQDWRENPAYRTVSLNPNADNFLRGTVLRLRKMIQNWLNDYNARGGKLSLDHFDVLFLQAQEEEIENTKRLFVHSLWTYSNLLDNVSMFPSNNDFRKLRNLYIALSLCLIIDKTLVEANKARNLTEWKKIPEKRRRELGPNIDFNVVTVNGWITDGNWRTLIAQRAPYEADPETFVSDMLDKTLSITGKQGSEWKIRLLLLAWNLRNCGSHEIPAYDILANRFPDIVEALMHCLFLVVEQLR